MDGAAQRKAMKTRTLELIKEWEEAAEKDPARYFTRLWYGYEWWQLTPEEEGVFDIDRNRYPRMMASLEAYKALTGFHGEGGFTKEEIQEAEAHFQFGNRDDNYDDFKRFAKEYTDLSDRECMAIWWKDHFYHERQGLTIYLDEEPEAFSSFYQKQETQE
jgi:hypothetical protein